jgi:hypothetical protein
MSDVTYGILVFAALWILLGALSTRLRSRGCGSCGEGEDRDLPRCHECPYDSDRLEAERKGMLP